MLATVLEGTYLVSTSLTIQEEFVEYGDKPLTEAHRLVDLQVAKTDIVQFWIGYALVRDNHLADIH
jgi:hypothetical protein